MASIRSRRIKDFSDADRSAFVFAMQKWGDAAFVSLRLPNPPERLAEVFEIGYKSDGSFHVVGFGTSWGEATAAAERNHRTAYVAYSRDVADVPAT